MKKGEREGKRAEEMEVRMIYFSSEMSKKNPRKRTLTIENEFVQRIDLLLPGEPAAAARGYYINGDGLKYKEEEEEEIIIITCLSHSPSLG